MKVAQKRMNESAHEQDSQEVVEEELNQILDKISKSGYDSLSKYEKGGCLKQVKKRISLKTFLPLYCLIFTFGSF